MFENVGKEYPIKRGRECGGKAHVQVCHEDIFAPRPSCLRLLLGQGDAPYLVPTFGEPTSVVARAAAYIQYFCKCDRNMSEQVKVTFIGVDPLGTATVLCSDRNQSAPL